jgi:hypothetical protein
MRPDRKHTTVEKSPGRPVPRPFSLRWGKGEVVEEVSVERPHWEPTVQLLRYEDGTEALRFCYYHGDRFGRGPAILDEQSIAQFADALSTAPGIAAKLRKLIA